MKLLRSYINRTIATKIRFGFSLCGILIITFLGTICFYVSLKTLTDEVINYSDQILGQSANKIDYFYNDIKSSMMMLAGNSVVIDSMKNYESMDWKDKLNRDRKINELLSNINIFKPYVDDIILISNNGYVNNITGKKHLKTDYDFINTDWLKDALAVKDNPYSVVGLHKREYYYYLDYKYNTDTVSLIQKVYDPNGRVLGVILCDFNLDFISSSIQVESVSNYANMFVVDNDDKILFHSDKKLIGTKFESKQANMLNTHISGRYVSDEKNGKYLLIFNTSKQTGWKVIANIPMKEIYKRSNPIKIVTYICIALSIIIFITLSVALSLQIRKPLLNLIARMNAVGKGCFENKNVDYGYGEISIIGNKFEEMVNEVDILIRENYELTIMQKEAEYKALQSQINPHFLFNTIQLIETEIVCENKDESEKLLVKLSNLLRYAMDNQTQLVMLKQEIEYIQNYLSIYSKKYDGFLSTSYEIDETLLGYMIPKMILQPIVENCIKHAYPYGIKHGKILIKVEEKNEDIHIKIRDNGKGIDAKTLAGIKERISCKSNAKNSIGLLNVHERIKIIYGERYGIEIESQSNVFTEVNILIPRKLGGAGND